MCSNYTSGFFFPHFLKTWCLSSGRDLLGPLRGAPICIGNCVHPLPLIIRAYLYFCCPHWQLLLLHDEFFCFLSSFTRFYLPNWTVWIYHSFIYITFTTINLLQPTQAQSTVLDTIFVRLKQWKKQIMIPKMCSVITYWVKCIIFGGRLHALSLFFFKRSQQQFTPHKNINPLKWGHSLRRSCKNLVLQEVTRFSLWSEALIKLTVYLFSTLNEIVANTEVLATFAGAVVGRAKWVLWAVLKVPV